MREQCLIAFILGLIGSAGVQGQRSPERVAPLLPERVTAEIDVYPQIAVREISPQLVGTNLTPYAADKSQATVPATLARIKTMGIKTVRFPNGCIADQYNWKKPAPGQMTVDEFLDFCEAIGAEPYYTLNLQGGTEGLDGSPPAGALIEERIRYRHKAPNPCGYTDYHYGTLAEAVELARKYMIDRANAGKKPLTHFELGNENWGQARTDWPPEVYGATCEAYAQAIFQVLNQAQEQEGKPENVLPYFTMVGYPSTGNNQDPARAADRAIDLAWTAQVNRLAEIGTIDAVQEHAYAYGNNTGDTLIWTVHNLANILSLRNGVPNERLGGYADPELKYNLPLEWTEWNVKCWGDRPDDRVPLPNGGFENGLGGWSTDLQPPGQASAIVRPQAARRGSAGLELATGASDGTAQLRRIISIKDRLPLAAFGAGLWVKTDTPQDLQVMLRQVNDGVSKGAILGLGVATQPGTWQRLVISGALRPDTTDCELIIALRGRNARAWIDEVQPIAWKMTAGAMPLAANRFEQQLANVDALRVLLEWPTPRTHYHHLFGNYPCGMLSADGSERDNAAGFKLLDGRIGDQLVRTDVQTARFDYIAPAGGGTAFGPSAPTAKDIPVLSATTTRRGDDVYVILVNRSSDRPAQAQVNLHGCTVKPEADLRTLVGQDIDQPGAKVESASLAASNPLSHTVPPFSAQVLHMILDEVVATPLVVSTNTVEASTRLGLHPEPDTLTLSTTGDQPVRFEIHSDADWLTITPDLGRLISEQPQTIEVNYNLEHLAPGRHAAILSVLSPDVYNGYQTIPVSLEVRPVRADFDGDGDVDQSDLEQFETCILGPPAVQASPTCEHARLTDRDGVDIRDYRVFESCMSGPGHIPGEECGG